MRVVYVVTMANDEYDSLTADCRKHWRRFLLAEGEDGGEIETPKGRGMGGGPLRSRLGGLGERRKLPHRPKTGFGAF